MLRRILPLLALSVLASQAAPPEAAAAVKTYEGKVSIPTYTHSGREPEPALFGNSTLSGLYPFTTYVMPFQGGPKPRDYQAVFVENEYLKLTYIPEFGGRIFSLYDKLRGREVFYRNDVVKPAHYNPRLGWVQSGLEITGPYDAHMLTLNGEPFWSNKIIRNADGSISLVLGEIDPVYRMKVNLTATLHPGVAALEMSVFCYNPRDGRMPQMFWLSTALSATEKTRFIYPMTRTIGHTTSEIADWPVFNGVDYSWDRNNRNMLGVFGIDIYDDFQGAYQFDRDYGVFRYADRRIVQGMKMWTFGYGPNSKNLERGYTDNAGPYVEVQSGRHVWDGHYEWVAPHRVERWSEWWTPVAGIGGLTTITRDVALNLDVQKDSVTVALSPVRAIRGAKLTVRSSAGELLSASADLVPGTPFRRTVALEGKPVEKLVVTLADAAGREVLNYHRPDDNPGRKEYTPFTRGLEKPQKTPAQMSIEELVLAAEFKLKELKTAAGVDLLNQALERDPDFSGAHLQLGIHHFNAGRHERAVTHLEKAIARNPYLDEAYYYLSVSLFALGRDREAERNLYHIWPTSGWYGERQYHLGRLAILRGDFKTAVEQLEQGIRANGNDLLARLSLALALRAGGDSVRAAAELAAVERIDPTSRPAVAERLFLSSDAQSRAELVRLMGGQSQEAIEVSAFYRGLGRWREAAEVLRLVERNNKDPWGTPAEFYYVLAYSLERSGDVAAARESRSKARSSARNVDRFPYREDSEAPLAAAVAADPEDAVARHLLACLLYHRERPAEAIRHWEAAVKAAPGDFSARRSLGLAYAEQSRPVAEAAAQLEKAIEVNPAHVRTLNDLSGIYARAGQFDQQLVVLEKALRRSPGDDDLAEAILGANLIQGRYAEAERLVATHRFAPRHRVYTLRDKYRLMRYGMGAAAFREGKHAEALKLFESAMKPPVSLGMDDFQNQSTPEMEYYVGRTLEALGRKSEAEQAYQRAVSGVSHLSGDRDSWSSENFAVVPALEKLGRGAEAAKLLPRFEAFARTNLGAKTARRRAEARYLLALVEKHAGRPADARKLLEQALADEPDFVAARLALRGEVLD